MISMRKMLKNDIGILYEIALKSFKSDYEKYKTCLTNKRA